MHSKKEEWLPLFVKLSFLCNNVKRLCRTRLLKHSEVSMHDTYVCRPAFYDLTVSS